MASAPSWAQGAWAQASGLARSMLHNPAKETVPVGPDEEPYFGACGVHIPADDVWGLWGKVSVTDTHRVSSSSDVSAWSCDSKSRTLEGALGQGLELWNV
eukprot:1141191-Pelagomonas_calceolata.AAC.4